MQQHWDSILHMGFETTGRDALDATGKPFPILHLQIPPIRLRKGTLEDIDLLRALFTQSVQNTCSADYNRLQIQAWTGRGTLQRWHDCFKATYTFCWQKTAESLRWQDSHLSTLKDICIACSYIPTINARE